MNMVPALIRKQHFLQWQVCAVLQCLLLTELFLGFFFKRIIKLGYHNCLTSKWSKSSLLKMEINSLVTSCTQIFRFEFRNIVEFRKGWAWLSLLSVLLNKAKYSHLFPLPLWLCSHLVPDLNLLPCKSFSYFIQVSSTPWEQFPSLPAPIIERTPPSQKPLPSLFS